MLACVACQMGTARASNEWPAGVNATRRLRMSAGSGEETISPRRARGLSAAVSVVRSMARRAATEPMLGGVGRFKDIMSENWPWVRPNGWNAPSKRRASVRAARCARKQMQQSRTCRVTSTEGASTIARPVDM